MNEDDKTIYWRLPDPNYDGSMLLSEMLESRLFVMSEQAERTGWADVAEYSNSRILRWLARARIRVLQRRIDRKLGRNKA